jgi:hypothetical protein
MRSGSSYGYGLRSTPSIMLKMVVLIPMPNPRQRMPTAANPLLCHRLRTAWRISRRSIGATAMVACRTEGMP